MGLVNQLLEFQKVSAGKRGLALTPIDVTKFLASCGEYVVVSLPSVITHDPACVVVSEIDGTPVGELRAEVAPIPDAPWIANNVIEVPRPGQFVVAVTTAFDSGVAAVAVHTSTPPDCAFARLASVHVRPPPVTVDVRVVT